MKSIYTTFLLLCLSLTSSWGQKYPIYYGVGLRSHSLQDLGYSPLVYNGNGIFLELSKILYTKRTRINWSTQLNYSTSKLSPKQLTPSSTSDQNLRHHEYNISLSYTKQLLYKNKFIFFIGALARINLGYTKFNSIANNPIAYDLTTSLIPKITFLYHFSFTSTSFEISSPILSHVMRPHPNGFFPTKSGDISIKAIWNNSKTHSFINYSGLQIRIKTSLNKFNQNNVKLFYNFNTVINNSTSRRSSIQHTFGINFFIHKYDSGITYKCPTE